MNYDVLVKKIVNIHKDIEGFWSNADGWAPNEANELLEKSRLDWQLSLSKCLNLWQNIPDESGYLILAWANLGSLVEGTMKLFIHPSLVETLELPVDQFRFTIYGGFNYERFVSINYSSRDPGFMQFGTFILELHSVPNTMKGKFIGFGPLTDRIIAGDVLCKRA